MGEHDDLREYFELEADGLITTPVSLDLGSFNTNLTTLEYERMVNTMYRTVNCEDIDRVTGISVGEIDYSFPRFKTSWKGEIDNIFITDKDKIKVIQMHKAINCTGRFKRAKSQSSMEVFLNVLHHGPSSVTLFVDTDKQDNIDLALKYRNHWAVKDIVFYTGEEKE